MDLEAGALEGRPFKLLRKIKIKALITDLQVLEPLRKCKYGCGAMVWPAEGALLLWAAPPPGTATSAPLPTSLGPRLTSTPTCALRRSPCAAAPWSWRT